MSTAEQVLTDWTPVSHLAPLLIYPTAAQPAQAGYCRDVLLADAAELLPLVDASLEFLERQPIHELEELYTRTFDLNPTCTLEVGWHLYGEQYERGRFLVRAREMLAAVGQDEAGELPDFLPSLLLALGKCEPQDAVDLAAYLVPAVRKMCTALEDKQSPYHPILVAVKRALEARVPEDAIENAESRYRPHMTPPRQGLVKLGSNEGLPNEARAEFGSSHFGSNSDQAEEQGTGGGPR